mmetsp:Transcript_26577/g.74343  ORF Transcript_26577/g.74343 Transcript_26577/m.74343 type:complete len:104 (+) Transcript_26577:1649-1960(+)
MPLPYDRLIVIIVERQTLLALSLMIDLLRSGGGNIQRRQGGGLTVPNQQHDSLFSIPRPGYYYRCLPAAAAEVRKNRKFAKKLLTAASTNKQGTWWSWQGKEN